MRTTSLEYMVFVSMLVLLLFLKKYFIVYAGYLPILDNGYFGDIPDPTSDPSKDGIGRLEDAVFSVLKNVRYIMGAVVVAIIVYAASMMVYKGNDEGEMTKQKSTITYAIIGMAVIGVAGAVTELLSVQNGGFLNPETAKERVVGFRVEVNLIITFIKYFLGSLATLYIVISALGLVMNGGDETTVTNTKKKLSAAALGLLLVVFSSTFIDKVFYVIDLNADRTGIKPQIDYAQGIKELVAITNIVVTFVGPIMIIVLVAGGIMYAVSGVDESQAEKAKKLITNAIIGIVVIYGAFAIVSTFISGQISRV